MFKADDKWTEAVTIFRQEMLILNISQINHGREEKLYTPQKEIEKLENEHRILHFINKNV